MLNVLKYIKENDPNFEKNHPIIYLSSNDIYAQYKDYYIKDGFLFVLGVKAASSPGQAYYSVDVINPDFINFVGTPFECNATDMNAYSSLNLTSKIKSLIKGLVEGDNNFGIPLERAWITLDNGYNTGLTANTSIGSNHFTIKTPTMDENLMVSNPGKTIVEDRYLTTAFDKVSTVNIPLQYVDVTKFKDIVPDEILEACSIYKTNLFGPNKVEPFIDNRRQFNMGERCIASYREKDPNTGKVGDTKYKYFISKINRNWMHPMSKEAIEADAWKEYTP